jgi:hypothetical protein
MEDLKYRHTGFVRNGVKYYDNPAMQQKQVEALEGKRFVEIIYDEKDLELITAEDRAYYFGGVIQDLQHSDYYKDFSGTKVHEDLMEMFYAEKQIKHGIEKIYIPSISKFNQQQFRDYIQKIINHAALNLNVKVKERGEYYASKRFKMTE